MNNLYALLSAAGNDSGWDAILIEFKNWCAQHRFDQTPTNSFTMLSFLCFRGNGDMRIPSPLWTQLMSSIQATIAERHSPKGQNAFGILSR